MTPLKASRIIIDLYFREQSTPEISILDELNHVKDLLWYDGPLISHMVHQNGEHYLCLWVDCNETETRWMFMRTSEENIILISNSSISLESVIVNACLDEHVYFVDRKSNQLCSWYIVNKQDVPIEYLPEPGTYLKS